jgi:hypothetical protein
MICGAFKRAERHVDGLSNSLCPRPAQPLMQAVGLEVAEVGKFGFLEPPET